MGGFGSGQTGGRLCTDDMRPLDVRAIHRRRLLKPGCGFDWQWSRAGQVVAAIRVTVGLGRVTLSYRVQGGRSGSDQPEQVSYEVALDWTSCHLGGERPWWVCPSAGCLRRTAILYGGRVFACRHCHRLAYKSSRERPDDRAARRAEAIRARLGWEPGILNGEGEKPKGMHWRTFERLREAHQDLSDAALWGIVARLDLFRR